MVRPNYSSSSSHLPSSNSLTRLEKPSDLCVQERFLLAGEFWSLLSWSWSPAIIRLPDWNFHLLDVHFNGHPGVPTDPITINTASPINRSAIYCFMFQEPRHIQCFRVTRQLRKLPGPTARTRVLIPSSLPSGAVHISVRRSTCGGKVAAKYDFKGCVVYDR